LYYIVNYILLILFSIKLIVLLLGKCLLSFAFYILTIYHKAPTNQDSIAQRTEDEISASPRIDTESTLWVGGGIQGVKGLPGGCWSVWGTHGDGPQLSYAASWHNALTVLGQYKSDNVFHILYKTWSRISFTLTCSMHSCKQNEFSGP